MKWTIQAKARARRALRAADGDMADAAIAYAEQLADELSSDVVDSDVWQQAWTVVLRAQRLSKHHPPALRHQPSDSH